VAQALSLNFYRMILSPVFAYYHRTTPLSETPIAKSH